MHDETVEQDSDVYKGHFVATIRNASKRQIATWTVQLEVPPQLLIVPPQTMGSYVQDMSNHERAVFRTSVAFAKEKPLWAGQAYAFKLDYQLTEATQGFRSTTIRATAYVDAELQAEVMKRVDELTTLFGQAFVGLREARRGAKAARAHIGERLVSRTMKRPEELDPLSAADRETVDEVLKEAEEWLATHDEYNVNRLEGDVPERVWREVVRHAADAGWNATLQGVIVSIKKPG